VLHLCRRERGPGRLPLQLQHRLRALPPLPAGLRPVLAGLRPGLRSLLWSVLPGLRPVLAGLRSVLPGVRPLLAGLRPVLPRLRPVLHAGVRGPVLLGLSSDGRRSARLLRLLRSETVRRTRRHRTAPAPPPGRFFVFPVAD
jgi:hypothetical protein